MKTIYKYIKFEKAAKQAPKTSIWECRNIRSNSTLGIVKWYPSWRQYSYFPTIQAVYSSGCMGDISDFLNQLNNKGISKSKIRVGRHIEGITLNALDYLLDENDHVLLFDSEDEAKGYLKKRGFTDYDIYYLVFEKVELV